METMIMTCMSTASGELPTGTRRGSVELHERDRDPGPRKSRPFLNPRPATPAFHHHHHTIATRGILKKKHSISHCLVVALPQRLQHSSPDNQQNAIMGTKGFFTRRSLKADDSRRTAAAELTLRQSIFPLCLVTVLFFL